MVPVFLSAAWLDLLAGSFPTPDPDLRVEIEQVIVDAPPAVTAAASASTGEVRYRITIADGRVEVRAGTSGNADLIVRTSYDIAVALVTGAISANDALRTGAIKITGDLRRLQTATAAAAGLGPALAGVRDQTTYLPVGP